MLYADGSVHKGMSLPSLELWTASAAETALPPVLSTAL